MYVHACMCMYVCELHVCATMQACVRMQAYAGICRHMQACVRMHASRQISLPEEAHLARLALVARLAMARAGEALALAGATREALARGG